MQKTSSIIATNCHNKTTANDNDDAGIGYHNLLLCQHLLLWPFLVFFCFEKAGSNKTTAIDKDDTDIRHHNNSIIENY